MPPFVTKDVDYCCEDNYSLAQRTVFDPQMTLAELDVKDIDNVAACSANRYSVLTVRLFTCICVRFIRSIVHCLSHFICSSTHSLVPQH